jgi:tetraacyldisaccharide 4'-kinase
LREPVARAVGRAGAAVILGEDRRGVAKLLGDLPILHAKLEPEVEAAALVGQRVVAFAGIGRPEKFFHSLRALGAKVIESYSFPDHHPYHPNEIGELHAIAEKHSAGLITTTKDFVRVPAHMRETIAVLRVGVTWDDETALMEVLSRALRDPALS